MCSNCWEIGGQSHLLNRKSSYPVYLVSLGWEQGTCINKYPGNNVGSIWTTLWETAPKDLVNDPSVWVWLPIYQFRTYGAMCVLLHRGIQLTLSWGSTATESTSFRKKQMDFHFRDPFLQGHPTPPENHGTMLVSIESLKKNSDVPQSLRSLTKITTEMESMSITILQRFSLFSWVSWESLGWKWPLSVTHLTGRPAAPLYSGAREVAVIAISAHHPESVRLAHILNSCIWALVGLFHARCQVVATAQENMLCGRG